MVIHACNEYNNNYYLPLREVTYNNYNKTTSRRSRENFY